MTKDEEKGYIERVLAGDGSAYEPLVTENQTKGTFAATAGFPYGSTG